MAQSGVKTLFMERRVDHEEQLIFFLSVDAFNVLASLQWTNQDSMLPAPFTISLDCLLYSERPAGFVVTLASVMSWIVPKACFFYSETRIPHK